MDELQVESTVMPLAETGGGWPPLPGEYFVVCSDSRCSVAVATLASAELAEALAGEMPDGLSIVGKLETENIGIDKLIKNTIANPALRYLILAGRDPDGHFSGRTLLALFENGVDENMRVIASPGRRPILKNVTREEIAAFRAQVAPVNMIGTEDIHDIKAKITELSSRPTPSPACGATARIAAAPISAASTPRLTAPEPKEPKLDKTGYFVIIPDATKHSLIVEHYSNDNELLHTIEGASARSLYLSIIENGWVSELSHAAYLGKELEKAELSLKLGFKYVQDGM